jgi:hypothetical protein
VDSNERNELILLLVRHLASGKLQSKEALPVLRQLLGEPATTLSRRELIEVLSRQNDIPAARTLVRELHRTLLQDAVRCHSSRREWESVTVDPQAWPELAHLPPRIPFEWQTDEYLVRDAQHLLKAVRAWYFLRGRSETLPRVRGEVGQLYHQALGDLRNHPSRWKWFEAEALPENEVHRRIVDARRVIENPLQPALAGLDEDTLMDQVRRAYEASASDREKRQRLLDLVLTWPTEEVASTILFLCREESEQDRASLVLMLRFGKKEFTTWDDWARWLAHTSELARQRKEALREIRSANAADFRLIGCLLQKSPDPALLERLENEAVQRMQATHIEDFIEEWHSALPPQEINELRGIALAQPGEAPPVIAPARVAAAPVPPVIPAAPPAPLPERPMIPPKPREPTVWQKHIQPFLAENWYMVAGLVMVVIGASLLAYFTWDKWLVRYTIMPVLLALLTSGLAGTGSWLESRAESLKGTAAMLRGAAICLLPINFMVVAIFSNDPAVANKIILVPLMALIYAGFFGWQLGRWCRAVHAELKLVQSGALLLLSALVVLEPLARFMARPGEEVNRMILTTGFYFGFVVLAASLWFFARRILTTDLVVERRVPWFFVGTMGLTFLEGFALAHIFTRYLPPATTYAIMAILAGSLVLFLERRFIVLESRPDHHREESFAGFALILLGLLMSWHSPELRIAALVLAGTAWIYQAAFRAGTLHYWIGLTLLMLGGAAVGMLDDFPKSREANWLPWLGLAIALFFGGLRICSRCLGVERLTRTVIEFQPVVLILTAAVSVLSQWHYRSAPIETGAALIVVAAFFAWRAHRVQRLGWVHTTMALLALALPYLGCVDMEGRDLHGNSMVFGLAILSALWLLLIHWRPTPLLIQARSTVIWSFGALAVAGMLMRVAIEQGRPGDIYWYRALMDYAGPYLMTVVLLITAYHSRSLVPSIMAAIIIAVLFPELKARFKEWYPFIEWGTGLGSAVSALGMILVAFLIPRWKFLQNLGEGDLFLGKTPFPGRRNDHTLFTIPLIGTAVFLAARVDTWTVFHQLASTGLPLKTVYALGITGAIWTLLAIHLRAHAGARIAVHVGWILFFFTFFYGNPYYSKTPQFQMPFLLTGLLLQALFFLYRDAANRHPWVKELLLAPTHLVLRWGSVVVGWGIVVCLLLDGRLCEVRWVGAFVLLQLGWHGYAKRHAGYGVVLFAMILVGLLASCTLWGRDPLLLRLTVANSLSPVLCLVLLLQFLQLGLELHPDWRERLRAFVIPFRAGNLFLVSVISVIAFRQMLDVRIIALTLEQQGLLLATIMLAARAHRSGALVLVAMLLTYLFVQTGELRLISPMDHRLVFLATPWRAAILALSMAMLAYLGQQIHKRWPALLAESSAVSPSWVRPLVWVELPAAIVVGFTAVYHTVHPVLHLEPVQLWAPYLGVLTLTVIACSWRYQPFGILAGMLLCLANIHAVNVAAGPLPETCGMSNIHVVCVGLIITLLQGSLLRRLVNVEAFTRRVNQGSTLVAGAVLTLLAFNYFADSNLTAIRWERFALSGVLAFAAARYFRHAARQPAPGEEPFVEWYEGFYHFGVCVTLWCAMLLIPELRYPSTVLLALGVPVIYFYLCAELGLHSTVEARHTAGRRYVNSASALGFLLLFLYVFRAAFQMVLFPNDQIDINHYHYNAPIVLLLSFLLFRLHGLGGTSWLAFYGGLALMVGSYFCATSWPGLSPFEHAIPAAWAAVLLAHLLIVASFHHSPMRSILQELGGISDGDWLTLRKYWGRCLLVASQFMVFLGLLHYRENTYQVALLLTAAASIFIHQGIVGPIPWYHGVAAIQLVLALHVDFWIPSYLPREDVIWVLLALWGAAVFVHPLFKQRVSAEQIGPLVAILFAGGMAHVAWHDPTSATGLWAVAIMAMLGALTPRRTRNPATGEQRVAAALLLLAAPWLVYFSQVAAPAWKLDLREWLATWPVLAATAAVFAVGATGNWYQRRWSGALQQREISQPRILHHLLSLWEQHGGQIHRALLWATFGVISLVVVTHYQQIFRTEELLLVLVVYVGLAVAWYHEGKAQPDRILPPIMVEFAVLALFVVLRRHLMLVLREWNYEYDVWISLVVSCGLTGAKRFVDRQPRGTSRSLIGTLCVMPILAIVWTMVRGLGTDMALMVVGINSLMFAFLGREERESPYNVVAIGGFVAFVIILFWSKLELRVLHAYVIPVGIGVLALLQLFGREMERDVRNRIRLVTLLAMLGTSGWYALVGGHHPLAFNFTMLALCLASMGLGSLFRIRLYLMMGFGGLLITVASIVYKVVIGLDTTYRMTSIGSLLLLLGVGLVAGSVYYKTHRVEFEQKLNRFRSFLGDWE